MACVPSLAPSASWRAGPQPQTLRGITPTTVTGYRSSSITGRPSRPITVRASPGEAARLARLVVGLSRHDTRGCHENRLLYRVRFPALSRGRGETVMGSAMKLP